MSTTENDINDILQWAASLETTGDIRIGQAVMLGRIGGFVYKSREGNWYIITNSSLSYEYQQKVLLHETKHIHDHYCNGSYIVELDNDDKYIHIESSADNFMELAASYIANRQEEII